jgi:hypothetical protein
VAPRRDSISCQPPLPGCLAGVPAWSTPSPHPFKGLTCTAAHCVVPRSFPYVTCELATVDVSDALGKVRWWAGVQGGGGEEGGSNQQAERPAVSFTPWKQQTVSSSSVLVTLAAQLASLTYTCCLSQHPLTCRVCLPLPVSFCIPLTPSTEAHEPDENHTQNAG